MDELGNYTYENARIYKERTKIWHNKHITRREFVVGQQVLFYNSHLRIFLRKRVQDGQVHLWLSEFFYMEQ